MPQQSSLKKVGRPKDSAKRTNIVEAAVSLFGRQPYETVTMEAVAAQAGVSKMTVYSHFTDKETLFETVVRSIADQMLSGVPEAAQGTGTLQERLTAMGRSFLSVILAPENIAMSHSLPATLCYNPTLARRFYEAGPGSVISDLMATLSAAVAEGEVVIDDIELAAYDLASLWEGGLRIQLAFQVAPPATPDEVARRAQRGTALFLRAYRPDVTSAGGEASVTSNPRPAHGTRSAVTESPICS